LNAIISKTDASTELTTGTGKARVLRLKYLLSVGKQSAPLARRDDEGVVPTPRSRKTVSGAEGRQEVVGISDAVH
jgi:hypothetical protein